METHIHGAGIAGAVGARCKFIETENRRQIASGIDTWTVRVEEGRDRKQRVGIDVAAKPVQDTSGLGIDRVGAAAALDVTE